MESVELINQEIIEEYRKFNEIAKAKIEAEYAKAIDEPNVSYYTTYKIINIYSEKIQKLKELGDYKDAQNKIEEFENKKFFYEKQVELEKKHIKKIVISEIILTSILVILSVLTAIFQPFYTLKYFHLVTYFKASNLLYIISIAILFIAEVLTIIIEIIKSKYIKSKIELISEPISAMLETIAVFGFTSYSLLYLIDGILYLTNMEKYHFSNQISGFNFVTLLGFIGIILMVMIIKTKPYTVISYECRNRLTKKAGENYYPKRTMFRNYTKELNKLGKLEDIEDVIGLNISNSYKLAKEELSKEQFESYVNNIKKAFLNDK